MKTLISLTLLAMFSVTTQASDRYFDVLHAQETQDVAQYATQAGMERERLTGYLQDAKIYHELGLWNSGYLYLDDVDQALPPHSHPEEL